MKGLAAYVPGASAEQRQQALASFLAVEAACTGARYNTLSHDPARKRFRGDVVSPMDARPGRGVLAAQLQAAVVSAAEAPHLPGRWPAGTWEGMA